MATKKRGRCVYTQFEKKILCAGSLDKMITVQKRQSSTTEYGDNIEATPSFTTVSLSAGALESAENLYLRRMSGVSVEDQSAPNFTHACYIPYDQTIFELDLNVLFVLVEGNRSRRFKMKGIKDYNEDETWIQMRLAETGFSDLEGASG